MKRILTNILVLCSFLLPLHILGAGGTWKLHHTFDSDLFQLIDTPSRLYTLGYAQQYKTTMNSLKNPYFYVIYFDKKTGEFMYPTAQDVLSETVGSYAEYNTAKRYLLVVYENYNIDLIYDDGRVVNIPGYMNSSVAGDKSVNTITFAPEHDRAYLATNFGYVEIDDKKGVIAASRNYGEPVQSMCRIDDKLLLLIDQELMEGDASKSNFNLTDFRHLATLDRPKRLLPLKNGKVGIHHSVSYYYDISIYDVNTGELPQPQEKKLLTNQINPSQEGYLLGSGGEFMILKHDGTFRNFARIKDDFYRMAVSWDLENFYVDKLREGIKYCAYNKGKWEELSPRIYPETSTAFRCTGLQYHPKYGMLALNHGHSKMFENYSEEAPVRLSAYSSGRWQRLGLPYTDEQHAKSINNPCGPVVDPGNNKYIYYGSMLDGLVRHNLEDPNDFVQIGHDGHPAKDLSGFHAVEKQCESWARACRFSEPSFDSRQNLWTIFNDMDDQSNIHLRYWTLDNRLGTTPTNYKPMGNILLKGQKSSNLMLVKALQAPANKNLIVVVPNNYNTDIIIYDHNGTLDNTYDDRMTVLSNVYNQDGGEVSKPRINQIYEDSATGLVWFASEGGVFYLNPENAFRQHEVVTQPKVNRNDGSGFADYLLNGVNVTYISSDGAGRKWFSTIGAGLVCTTSDARNIVEEYSVSNSWIPSDDVLAAEFNPENGSIMVATMLGLATLYPAGSATAADDLSSVRAYPNPVRPDFYGWITIDGLTDNAVVKIVDAAGNLIKELDKASGGQTQWDATTIKHQRVATGVYYVVAGSGPGDTNLAKVAKILVIQ